LRVGAPGFEQRYGLNDLDDDSDDEDFLLGESEDDDEDEDEDMDDNPAPLDASAAPAPSSVSVLKTRRVTRRSAAQAASSNSDDEAEDGEDDDEEGGGRAKSQSANIWRQTFDEILKKYQDEELKNSIDGDGDIITETDNRTGKVSYYKNVIENG
jgi:hypothetical protein